MRGRAVRIVNGVRRQGTAVGGAGADAGAGEDDGADEGCVSPSRQQSRTGVVQM